MFLVNCDRWAESLVAMASGDEPPVERALVDAHVRQCPSCRELRDTLAGERPAPTDTPAVDIAAAVGRRAARDDRHEFDRTPWGRALRFVLAGLAIQILVLAAPAMLWLDDGASSPHDARHTGSFAAAFAVGLLLVARRPARARTMLTVGQVLLAGIALSTTIDLLDGTVSITDELFHLPEVVAVVVLWQMARLNATPAGAPGSGTRPAPLRRVGR